MAMERLFCHIVVLFPLLARTNTVLIAEKWIRFGLLSGTSVQFCDSMRAHELAVRGKMHIVEDRIALGLPYLSESRDFFNALEAAVREYCAGVPNHPEHSRYLSGALTTFEGDSTEDTVSNEGVRFISLQAFALSPRAHGLFVPPAVVARQGLREAFAKVRTEVEFRGCLADPLVSVVTAIWWV